MNMPAPKGNKNHLKHGLSHTRIDNIYKAMISRCYHRNNNRYDRYGGRGVCVCDAWLEDKTQFFEWAFLNGYSDNLTLDRVEVNGDYSPQNCRWVTQKKQQNNRTNNRNIEFNGVLHTLAEWSEITGITQGTIWARLKSGWTTEKALTTIPVLGNNQFN